MTQLWTEERLSGWGRFPQITTQSARPVNARALKRSFDARGAAQILPYGLGRSYGDSPLLEEGRMIHMRGLDRFLDFDPESGWLRCEAGVSIQELIQYFLPRGFFPPVVPGTQFVTLGGAVANDIHGKNHHIDGTICDHIRNLKILTGSGEVITCDQTQHPALFEATVGGLGLTGIILELEIKLCPVHGPGIEMESIRVESLDEFFEVSAASAAFTHTVSWIDCAARGARLGRGIFMRGRHSEETPNPRLLGRLERTLSPLLKLPFDAPRGVMNRFTVRAFNEAYFHKHPKGKLEQITHYEPFFFPLDFVQDWNRIYGPDGFLQYQLVVPNDPDHLAIREVLEEISASGMGSFLAVIKEFGERQHGGLSFPRPGVTLALDFPNYGAPLFQLLERLDAIVIAAGGRVYLGKDARLPKESFQKMYPEWESWRALRDEWDPEGVFSSMLGARLGLCPAREEQPR